MSVNAYVLLNVEPTKTAEVRERLNKLKGAVVREVLGPYDFIVELEGDTHNDITSVVRSKVRSIHGVTSTVTCTWSDGALGAGGGQ